MRDLPGRLAGPLNLGRWGDDPLWGAVYHRLVESPVVGGVAWRVGLGSDLGILHATVASLGDLPAGTRVLDMPCGGGVALRGVRPGQGLAYVAADLDPVMLGRTRRRAEERGLLDQVRLVEADVTRLPFGDAEFDVVATFTGLHCFPEPQAAIVELTRVLAPGGRLLGSTLLRDSLRGLPTRVGGRLAGILGPGITGTDLTASLRAAGLDDVRLERSGAVGFFEGRLPA